jgi:hypothetical protein
MENYFEKDTFIIRYDEENHLLIHEWKVSPTSQEFKEATNILIPAFEHFKTGKLVADVRRLGAVHPDDQQWILTDWTPRVRKAGFSHSAVIIPQDIFTQMSLEGMSDDLGDLPSKNFDNMEAAINWLKQF